MAEKAGRGGFSGLKLSSTYSSPLALRILINMTNNALLLVDIQYDFISGTLAVPGAEEILAPTYNLLDNHRWDLVIASQASQIRQ